MLPIIFRNIYAPSLNRIILGGRREFSGQHFCYPKMKEQLQEECKPMKKGPTPKLRGHQRDSPDIRLSKSLSWLLRHGAEKAGLNIRQDGYARVSDVLSNPMFRDVTFVHLQDIVKRDQKSRYHLLFEPQTSESTGADLWWIRANQGHSMKNIELDLQPITSASELPMAVHGTTRQAWQLIAIQGLSKMTRNHIHLAQNVPGSNVISGRRTPSAIKGSPPTGDPLYLNETGMRNSSQILIFVNVQKAINAGIKFYLSANGVVLTEGNSNGFLPQEFFLRVENGDRTPVEGWEGSGSIVPDTPVPADYTIDEVAMEAEIPGDQINC